MNKDIYITTSIPYVNAAPHVGFALELVQADVIARYHRLLGKSVHFQTGTDENALKNVFAARERGIPPQQLVDGNARRFRHLCDALVISHDDFIRTTESRHRAGVELFWRSLAEDDLYRQEYTALHCHGCADVLKESDLVDGKCPDHQEAPVLLRELNWFFRLSRYQDRIRECIASDRLKVVPVQAKHAVLAFIDSGLRDISVSRCAARHQGWGIPVPGDPSQVIYVWIDALVNYLSGPGFGTSGDWRSVWNPGTHKLHCIGKNVWKFHAIYWPALLLSAGLPLPDEILVHGFLTVNGRKISKSNGTTVDPFTVIDEVGADGLRYFLLRGISPFADGDFSLDRLKVLYNTDVANGLGNLLSRVTRLCEKADYGRHETGGFPEALPRYSDALDARGLQQALGVLWGTIDRTNREIEATRPWELLRNDDDRELRASLAAWLDALRQIGHWLEPFLPGKGRHISDALASPRIVTQPPLFPRLQGLKGGPCP